MSATRPEQLYETDFYAWTQAQAKELRRFARTRPNVPLDLAHIAEEMQELARASTRPYSARCNRSCSIFCNRAFTRD